MIAVQYKPEPNALASGGTTIWAVFSRPEASAYGSRDVMTEVLKYPQPKQAERRWIEMSITCTCSACEKRLAVKAQYAGRRAKCPTCRTSLTVPNGSRPHPQSERRSRKQRNGQVTENGHVLWKIQPPSNDQQIRGTSREDIREWLRQKVAGAKPTVEGLMFCLHRSELPESPFRSRQ